METLRNEFQEPFNVSAEKMFEALITPKAIREWWGASRAIVDPKVGGSWVATYGEEDGSSEFINTFKLTEFDPPRRMVLGDGVLMSKEKGSPLVMGTTTEFVVVSIPEGCSLTIVHTGTPIDPESEDFYESSLLGWQNTFEGLRRYFHYNSDG